mmetsp:Transcript_12640/g.35535  ORF Transcript_12640/g.35535 Transcript_12640/m.35535 type:complete len:199 (+) Transcript_12640:424-1020(+)
MQALRGYCSAANLQAGMGSPCQQRLATFRSRHHRCCLAPTTGPGNGRHGAPLGKRDEGGRVLAGAGGWSAHVGAGGPEPASSFFLWRRMLSELRAFNEKHSHCQVPQDYSVTPELGTWVSTQRQLYRWGKLSAKKIALLEAIGFVWDEGAGQLGSDAPPPAALQGGGGAPPAPKAPRQSKVEVFGELPSHSAPHLQAG